MQLSPAQIGDFQETVFRQYDTAGRHDLAWRRPEPGTADVFNPYHILVSEIMLQQTQVSRVTIKYQEFLHRFPTVEALAAAELGDVLRIWSGLGYNRRAKFLHQAAQKIVSEYDGVFPHSVTELVKLPGVGVNTAGAIAAYAFNSPVVYIETNIRSVYIHHFFADATAVSDKDISELVAATLYQENPRIWYWALMDYGSFLKATVGNNARASAHYVKQSTFEGSLRKIRGQVLRELAQGELTAFKLREQISDERLDVVLDALLAESLIKEQAGVYKL